MKRVSLFLSLLSLFSCSKMQDSFKTKTKITPIAKAKKLAVIKGDGKYFTMRLKYPLTTEEVGMYKYNDVLHDGAKTDKLFLGGFGDMFKFNFANLLINFGRYSKIQYTTDLELPEVDPSFIKSITIKKIFFSLEPCQAEEKDCEIHRRKEKLTFRFLDKMFLNLSALGKNDVMKFKNDPIKMLGRKDFKRQLGRARYYVDADMSEVAETEKFSPFRNVTLAKYENDLNWFNQIIRKYEKVKDKGVYFIFKEENNYVAIKNFLKKPEFNGIIKDLTLMGDSVVVELYNDPKDENNESMKTRFFNVLNEAGFNESGLFAFDNDPSKPKKPEGCSRINCVNVEVNPVNLVPMLSKNNHLKIDTFLSINDVPGNDFKYKGYIELEVKMDVPL